MRSAPALQKVLTGHDGWVYGISFDPGNEWFATASADTTVKVWSLAGALKLTLTGHRLPVRAVAVHRELAYMFSGGEDRAVLCWDLETNAVCRHFHGHASGVYCVQPHPRVPFLLLSGSRDRTVRVWDVRSRRAVHVLPHAGAVTALLAQDCEPQLVAGTAMGDVVLWDLVAARARATLTEHTRAVRALHASSREYSFASGAECVREYALPDGAALGAFGARDRTEGAAAPQLGVGSADSVTSMAGTDGTLYVGYDSGALLAYDYATGAPARAPAAYAPLAAETSVLACALDATRTRLVTGHRDKAVRVWALDD